MANDWMMWAMILQQQAQQAAAERARQEEAARVKAEADAQAARDAEAKRQAQIAQQRQQDAAAAQAAEQQRQAANAALPGAADPYGDYKASINLDNSGTQNAARTIASSSQPAANSNPLSGFTNSAPKASGLASMFSAAVAPRKTQQSDFPAPGKTVGGNSGGQSMGGGQARQF